MCGCTNLPNTHDATDNLRTTNSLWDMSSPFYPFKVLVVYWNEWSRRPGSRTGHRTIFFFFTTNHCPKRVVVVRKTTEGERKFCCNYHLNILPEPRATTMTTVNWLVSQLPQTSVGTHSLSHTSIHACLPLQQVKCYSPWQHSTTEDDHLVVVVVVIVIIAVVVRPKYLLLTLEGIFLLDWVALLNAIANEMLTIEEYQFFETILSSPVNPSNHSNLSNQSRHGLPHSHSTNICWAIWTAWVP